MILVDATPLQSEHRLRGVGTYVRHLAPALALRLGSDVRFACSVRPRDTLPEAVLSRAVWGVRGHRPAQIYWLYNEWFLRSVMRKSGSRLFHATDFNGVVTWPHVVTVATLHDLIALEAPPTGFGPSAQASALRWHVYFHRKLARVHRLIAVSRHVKETAVRLLRLPADRIDVVYPGTDLTRFETPAEASPYRRYAPYLLFVGPPRANKNFHRVWPAFAGLAPRHPRLRLLVAGVWTPRETQWLEADATRRGLRGRVVVLGYVPPERMAGLFQHAAGLMFPSEAEGFGSPIVEAMAAGTPVITANRGAVAEVGGGAVLSVDPESVEDMARAMETLASRPRLREQLIRRGRARARRFSTEAMAEQTIAVYDRALAAPPNFERASSAPFDR